MYHPVHVAVIFNTLSELDVPSLQGLQFSKRLNYCLSKQIPLIHDIALRSERQPYKRSVGSSYIFATRVPTLTSVFVVNFVGVMFEAKVVGISLLSLLSAAILSPPSTPFNNAPPLPQTLSPPLLPSNITHPPSNTTSNVLRIQCDGTRYGRNLSPGSCRNVFHHIGKSDEQSTFAERHTGRPNDVPLPWRILSDDGRCFVQPLLLIAAVTGHASSTQMVQAAYTLLQTCVVGRGLGGIAADIGTSILI